MHEASFHTVHTDINDDKEDTSACAEILTTECGEDESGGIHQKMEQTETTTMAKGKAQNGNGVLSYIEIKSMDAPQMGRETKQLVASKIPKLVWTHRTTFCIARMKRRALQLVMSSISQLSKSFSICWVRKGWRRFSTNTSQNILTPAILPTRLVKCYYLQMPSWNHLLRLYHVDSEKPSSRNVSSR